MHEKNEKQLESIQSVRWVVNELWRKGFVEKMSFGPGVEERMSSLMDDDSGDEGMMCVRSDEIHDATV